MKTNKAMNRIRATAEVMAKRHQTLAWVSVSRFQNKESLTHNQGQFDRFHAVRKYCATNGISHHR